MKPHITQYLRSIARLIRSKGQYLQFILKLVKGTSLLTSFELLYLLE